MSDHVEAGHAADATDSEATFDLGGIVTSKSVDVVQEIDFSRLQACLRFLLDRGRAQDAKQSSLDKKLQHAESVLKDLNHEVEAAKVRDTSFTHPGKLKNQSRLESNKFRGLPQGIRNISPPLSIFYMNAMHDLISTYFIGPLVWYNMAAYERHGCLERRSCPPAQDNKMSHHALMEFNC